MHSFRHAAFFRGALKIAACLTVCCCAGLFTLLAYAAAPSAPQAARKIPSHKTARPRWDFQAPDRSAQSARWRESISATLQQGAFAPSAPAGRYLQHNAAASAKRLPPAQIGDLDKMRPPENKQLMLDNKASMHSEFTRESTGWRPHNELLDPVSAHSPALREELRAGAYAGFQPSEEVELRLGPEYHLGAAALRPEQTGHAKDSAGAFGIGMKLKIGF